MRLLFFGDVADTGFGTVTWALVPRLLNLGVDVRVLAMNMTGEPLADPLASRTWDRTRVDVSAIVRRGFADGWKPEAALIVSDFAGMEAWLDDPTARALGTIRSFNYVPIEGIGLPPAWAPVWSLIHPVAMTRFGAEQIATVIGYPPPVVPHGIDVATFHPFTARTPGALEGKPLTSRRAARLELANHGLPPDRIIAFRADRHMPRKGYNALFRAFARVFEATDDVDLLIHCAPIDHGGSLYAQQSKLPEKHRSRIYWTNAHDTYKGVPASDLAALYNAADIYVSSGAEGFGLTVAEAAACGLPIVGIDYAATPEVAGPAGVMVPVKHLIDNQFDHFWATIDEDAFADAVIDLARHPAKRRMLGNKGPGHVAANFDWDRSAAAFARILEGTWPVRSAA